MGDRQIFRNLALDIDYLHAKFDDSSFTRSTHMVGVYQNLNGSRDLTTPHELTSTG